MMKARIDTLAGALRAAVERVAHSHWPYFAILFALAFVPQYRLLQQIPSRYLVPDTSMELGGIAISLMKTGQFADPYMLPSGPTAHLPPLYPYLVSLIYRWYGLTPEAGFAAGLLIIGSGALLYALLPWLADQLGPGRLAGFLGGIAAAPQVGWAGHGEYLTGIALALILIVFLRRWNAQRYTWQGSLFLGFGCGAAFHLQPALLGVVLGLLVFELWWSQAGRKGVFLGLIVGGMVLACVPWGWRNYRVFNAVFFIRSNFGLELRMGNHEGAAATMEILDIQGEHIHPGGNFAEARKLRDIGEMAYMQEVGEQAFAWIGSHPKEFLSLSVQRFANLWAGPLHRPQAAAGVAAITLLAALGVWRTRKDLGVPQQAVLLIPLATYPLVYYFVTYMPRYRVPIDWILYLLAGAAVGSWLRPRGDQRMLTG